MDSASIGPCQFEHVIEVVWNAEELFFAVVGGGDGVDQKMSLRCCTDDVAVAVGAVSEDGTSHVGAVAVVVFCVVAARAQT